MRPVYIWRKGLVYWPEFGDGYVFDPHAGRFLFRTPQPGEQLLLVDVPSFSHRTRFKVMQLLLDRGFRVKIAYVEPLQVRPSDHPPIVALSGKPASGKSAIAHHFAREFAAALVKWGKAIAARYETGKYGELVTPQQEFELATSLQLPDQTVVLDGVKDYDVLQVIGYVRHRRVLPIWLRIDEPLRKLMVKMRGDADDAYDEQREKLFADRFKRLERECIVLDLSSNDHDLVLEFLRANGLEIRGRIAKSIFTPQFILEFYARVSSVPKAYYPDIPDEWIFHRRYPKKHVPALRRFPKFARVVNMLASAFRIIDDIIDEDETRRVGVQTIPALWTQIGIWPATARAAIMTLRAFEEDGWQADTLEMFRRVINAVRVELRADAEGRKLTPEEYELTLDREIAFREWIAHRIGLDVDAEKRKARLAQIENDRHAQGKEARRL